MRNLFARSPKKILTRAKNLLIEDGWCQREWENSWGEHCAVGALRAVANTKTNNYKLACEKLAEVMGGSIIGFNDSANDKYEVLAKFDEAITLL